MPDDGLRPLLGYAGTRTQRPPIVGEENAISVAHKLLAAFLRQEFRATRNILDSHPATFRSTS